MANYVSNYAKEAWLQGDVDLDADDIRVLLVKSTYDGDVEGELYTGGDARNRTHHLFLLDVSDLQDTETRLC